MDARVCARWAVSGSIFVVGCNAIVGVGADYRLVTDASSANGNDASAPATSGGAPGSGGASSNGGTSGDTASGGTTSSGGSSSTVDTGGAGGSSGSLRDGGPEGGRGSDGGAGGITGNGGVTGSGGTRGSGGACAANVCGGCTALSGKPGDACTPCGSLSCNGQNALACQSKCASGTPVCKTATNACVACIADADCKVAATPACLNNTCVACKPPATGCVGTTPRSCTSGGAWTNGTITAGQCGAACTPQTLRCQNLIGQACSADGAAWLSSGSSAACGCVAPTGRFLKVGANRVEDTQSGLTWDFPLDAAATYPNASADCTNKGMRLPTENEWSTLNVSMTQTASCIPSQSLGIDSVAFPDIAAAGSNPRYWTGEPENGFPGYLYVVYFTPGGGYGTTDRTSSQLVAYQCVSGP